MRKLHREHPDFKCWACLGTGSTVEIVTEEVAFGAKLITTQGRTCLECNGLKWQEERDCDICLEYECTIDLQLIDGIWICPTCFLQMLGVPKAEAIHWRT